jgi:superoxide oxidase
MTPRYSIPTIVLHWTMALVQVAAFIVGQIGEGMPRGPDKMFVMGWHAFAGIVTLALLLPRLLSRWLGTTPDNADIPGWEQRAAAATHLLFYALMIALPLTGAATVMSGRAPFAVAGGLFEVPNLLASHGLRDTFEAIHGVLAKLLLGAFVLHVVATIWHKLVRHDDVPGRMIPGLGK